MKTRPPWRAVKPMYIPHVLRGMTNAIGAVSFARETFSFLCRLETLLDAKFASYSPQ
jgi:hypothetical protein